ncbi:hypothetical protein BraRD5C2_37960 [Bradyrhizobium sp. RD5-C2]|nr:hypothetical protein BraRD5C2_37960 [Bradyrhizobium sp. RD5-C2]
MTDPNGTAQSGYAITITEGTQVPNRNGSVDTYTQEGGKWYRTNNFTDQKQQVGFAGTVNQTNSNGTGQYVYEIDGNGMTVPNSQQWLPNQGFSKVGQTPTQ